MSALTTDGGLDLGVLSPAVEAQVVDRIVSPQFDAWAETAARVGHCARPIRLHGSSQRIDTLTGEVLSTYPSCDEPLGLTHVRCGNRRESVCPSCSRVYGADTFHLIRAGVVGGKTVPETISANPLVFATLTAPSFGTVHGVRPTGAPCHPRTGAPPCTHGRSASCMASHADDDPLVGEPLCADCYDYDHHVLWQWWAPELWRRFTITLRRVLARRLGVPSSRLCDVVTLQYAKVAEYQARGAIHFHALVRLDGPRAAGGFSAAPAHVTVGDLVDAICCAAALVRYDAPPVDPWVAVETLRFGAQVDVKPIIAGCWTETGDGLSAEQVAGYLAKYATKSASDTADARPHSMHLHRLRRTVFDLSGRAAVQWCYDADQPYALLGRWAHMLGFRGHFSTKSRRYSVTLTQLRRARRRWQHLVAQSRRTGVPIDEADLERRLLLEEDDSTLVVGHWTYVSTGWQTEGDAALARAAAARAREYARQRSEHRHTGQPVATGRRTR